MYHPTTRVLAVLELLQTHGRLSGAEMAARLAVDGRTLRRYIATLEEIGIPVTTERGRHGGYALVPGFKLPPMMFTDGEALALAVGLLAARSLGMAEGAPAVASAQAKLERIMPAKLKQQVRAVGETVKLGLAPATAPADNTALLVLSSAAMTQHRVHLHYHTAQGPASERDFDPYGVVLHAGCWYAVGWCHLRRTERTFRLDRVQRAELLALSFERPALFDALAHLRKSVATLPRAFTVEVLLKTELERARGVLSAAMGVLEQTDAGVVLHNQSDDLGWFAQQLASLPFDFEIRKPAQLRTEVIGLAQRLLKCAQSLS
jgi:predicted DNA-binding transcriptional regulator YafY